MFAIGHFALGYLTGKAIAKPLHIQLNMTLLLTASVIPDVDLLLRFLDHRGPTHSLITIAILMTPFLIYYRKTALPYAVALASHSMIGDLIGGTQLLWPLSTREYGALDVYVSGSFSVTLELILFIIFISPHAKNKRPAKNHHQQLQNTPTPTPRSHHRTPASSRPRTRIRPPNTTHNPQPILHSHIHLYSCGAPFQKERQRNQKTRNKRVDPSYRRDEKTAKQDPQQRNREGYTRLKRPKMK